MFGFFIAWLIIFAVLIHTNIDSKENVSRETYESD